MKNLEATIALMYGGEFRLQRMRGYNLADIWVIRKRVQGHWITIHEGARSPEDAVAFIETIRHTNISQITG